MDLGQNKSFYLSQRLKCSCKHLTYKEWKRLWPTSRYLWSLVMGKYLTYKEWKQSNQISSAARKKINVSTLPIRNGNDTRAILTSLFQEM